MTDMQWAAVERQYVKANSSVTKPRARAEVVQH